MIVTPDQRLRIFVSSTLEELAPERVAAREAIEKLRLTPVLFELAARSHPPRSLYQAYVEQSDVFVAIYGENYGWIAPGMDISGLEDELRLAAGMPRLVYVERPAPGRDPRLQVMIDGIEAEAAFSYRTFGDAAELGGLIENDLALLLSERFQREPSEEARPRRELPAPVDRFVGRVAELDALERELLDRDQRLVTVTGPGGVGKTRLALEAARRTQGNFADGAVFVSLSSITEPGHVASAIQDALEVPAGPTTAAADAVVRAVGTAELLLVLDNFEHVLAAAPELGRLLEECRRLTTLVTSRAVLKLRGEREFVLTPLTLPEAEHVEDSDAVALFVERARAVAPSFELDAGNVTAVAAICRQLDGLPLAIEVVAGQLRLLPPESILDRLGRLRSTARAGAGYPERQQTLRTTIDWSFGLLTEQEQRAFTRASVFRPSFGLGAFEAVCGDESLGSDPLELLGSLVEKSLVAQETADGEPRFSMLETIRHYASEQLDERGETTDAYTGHAAFYLDLVDDVGTQLRGAGHQAGMARLDHDWHNVRAALDWSLEQGEHDRVAEAGWSLIPYWTFRERLGEGRRWMQSVIEGPDVPVASRAKAFAVAGLLAFWQGEYAAAVPPLTNAVELFRSLEDEHGVAFAQLPLGMIQCILGDAHAGLALLEASRVTFEQFHDDWGVSVALIGVAWALNITRADRPIELFERMLRQARNLGYEAETLALGALGRRRALREESSEAKRLLAQALQRVIAIDAKLGVAVNLDLLADLASNEGNDRLAVRLGEAAAAVLEELGAPFPALVGERELRLVGLRQRLGEAVFALESETGRALTVEEASAQAIGWARIQEVA